MAAPAELSAHDHDKNSFKFVEGDDFHVDDLRAKEGTSHTLFIRENRFPRVV